MGQKLQTKLNLIEIVKAVMIIIDRESIKLSDKHVVKSVDDTMIKKIINFDE